MSLSFFCSFPHLLQTQQMKFLSLSKISFVKNIRRVCSTFEIRNHIHIIKYRRYARNNSYNYICAIWLNDCGLFCRDDLHGHVLAFEWPLSTAMCLGNNRVWRVTHRFIKVYVLNERFSPNDFRESYLRNLSFHSLCHCMNTRRLHIQY